MQRVADRETPATQWTKHRWPCLDWVSIKSAILSKYGKSWAWGRSFTGTRTCHN